MNKLILPINAYIVNSNGSIVDAFSNMPSYGNENGAEVYHVYNADNNAYYNVLMTEELKAVIADTFNMPYAAGSYTGSVRVLTVGSDPKAFEWTPITSLVASPRIQGIYLNDKYLTPGRHGYSSVDGHTQSVLVYAKEPNFLYVTAPSGSAAYISLKSEGRGNGYIYYTEDPYSNNWSSLGDTSLNVAGKKYYLSGTVNPYVSTNESNYIHLVTSGANTISFYGDITYLVGNTGSSNYNEPAYKGGDKTLKNYQFYKFFYNCAQIIKAPDLPSTTIGSYCYYCMFHGCTNLVNAPELPATALATYCYTMMFFNCTSLTKAPELPATTLASHCYEDMFGYCTSLVDVPELPATTLAEYCYHFMFYNCISLTKAPKLPVTTLVISCYSSMFCQCISLTKAPELPATTLAPSCYYQMFSNCTSLTKAPELPATALVSDCYGRMFYNCTKLNYVKALFTTTPSDSYTNVWLSNVAGTGTFVKSVNATWMTVGVNAVPIGWTPYKTAQLDTDELPESYMQDTGKVLMIDASGLWTKKKIDVGSQIAYDSSNKTISLKDASGNVLGTPIDATDFIKDGMVSDVSVYNSNLVISFNTDAGKEDISIPLSHIFDSSNYYTKSELNDIFEDLDASLSETFSAISDVIEENELVTAAALTELDTSIGELKDNIGLEFDNIYDDLDDMQSTVSGLETASPWIYGTGENSAVLRTGNLTAKGTNSISHGYNADASGLYSHAEGETCKAWGQNSHAEGYYTLAFGSNSHAEGRNSGLDYNAIGKFTGAAGVTTYTVTSLVWSPDLYDFVHYRTKNTYARVLNVQRLSNSGVNNSYTVVLDRTLDASNEMNASVYRISHVAFGSNSHAEGETTKTPGQGAHAEGTGAIAAGQASHAEGYNTQARGHYSHAEGHATMSLGEKSHSEGFNTYAFDTAAHTEGLGVATSFVDNKYIVRITGDASATSYTTSTGHNLKPGDLLSYNPVGYIPSNIRNFAKVLTTPTATSFTVDKTLNPLIAFSDTSVVKLKGIATATASHAEGYYTKATGVGSHSEGYDTRTDSSYAHAEGESTDASGIGSHTEGYYTNTFANYSHAEGRYTRTSNVYEHAQGSYNMSHKVNTTFGNAGNTLNTIGIGTAENNRKNAVEVMQNGDVYITGIGNYDGSNYVDASTLQEVINDGGGVADLMTSVTYANLKNLRDTSALVPGMQYYIHDYITTVGDASLSSAMHPFGIIVTANSPSELDESARICKAENDEYYTNLDAYEIKYCIDNDSSRFGWVDSNGKGVIYYMKDDNRNEAYYDFTNILFDNKYTFDYNGTDARLNASANIHDNVIGPHYGGYTSAGSQQAYYTLSPNNIVFEGLMNYNNTFGNDCYDMKFSNQTLFNIFDGAVWDCSFGATTIYNHFGSYITGSIFPAKLATSDIGSNIHYVNVSGTTTPYIRCRIMPNIKGTSTSSRLSISITEIGQHAGLNSSGVLKKWLPADLID